MMQEEIFGPLLPVITVQKIEDGFQVIRSKPKPLAAYLFTNSTELQKQFVQNVSAGGMTINDTVLHVKRRLFSYKTNVLFSIMLALIRWFVLFAGNCKRFAIWRGWGERDRGLPREILV